MTYCRYRELWHSTGAIDYCVELVQAWLNNCTPGPCPGFFLINLGNRSRLKLIPCARSRGKKEEDYYKSEEQEWIANLRSLYPDLSTLCAERVAHTLTELLEIAHATHRCDEYSEIYTSTVVFLKIQPHGAPTEGEPNLAAELITREGEESDVEEEEVFWPKAKPATRASVTELLKAMPQGMEDDDANCGICMEVIKNNTKVRMPCSHPFHRFCLVRWLDNAHSCPICRYQLPTAHHRSHVPDTTQGA